MVSMRFALTIVALLVALSVMTSAQDIVIVNPPANPQPAAPESPDIGAVDASAGTDNSALTVGAGIAAAVALAALVLN
jgi:hypothetical protein